ncbi:MAG: patatin-like phospholipase family protein [Planctomycetes bacterium]|nr:patatin-like phospholipase family protein [Planctomycetota bacterium]
MTSRLLACLVALPLTGCGVVAGTVVDTAEAIVTYPLKEWVFWGAYRYDNPWDEPWAPLPDTHDEGEWLVGVCLSGGGSRSAYFAACVLEALGRARIPGSHETWLDELDLISSVSGGSLAATYFVANRGRAGFPAERREFFQRMRQDMALDFELRALARILCGWGFPLAMTYYDRGDLMASVWDSNFFDDLTFGDLPPDGPTLLVNAACYRSGQRFVFTRQPLAELDGARLFDDLAGERLLTRGYGPGHAPLRAMSMETLGSSIARCPLSTGVVASAAVPNLLGPVRLRDRVRGRDVHLGDGGIYDNHGLETMVAALARRLERDPGKRAVVFVVDGTGFFDTEAEKAGDLETVADFSDRPVTIAWLRASSYAEPFFRRALASATAGPGGGEAPAITFVPISLYDDAGFRRRGDEDDDGLAERLRQLARRGTVGLVEDLNERLRAVGTRFSITDDDCSAIAAATPAIVRSALARYGPPAPPVEPQELTGR